MSGDCFNQIWAGVEYNCLEELTKHLEGGLNNFEFKSFRDHKYMLHNIFEGYYKIAEANIWMKRLDWFLGGDDGEEAYQSRLADELHKLAVERMNNRRCFDCVCMHKEGCTSLKDKKSSLPINGKICSLFIPENWTEYKIQGDPS